MLYLWLWIDPETKMPNYIFILGGTCALISMACLTALWLVSLKIKDASIIDIFWGFGFVLVGLTCLMLTPLRTPYIWLICLLPILWGLRLTLYLARRNLGHGEDRRYVAMRNRSGMAEAAWRKRAFFTIFLGQGLLILIISAPIWVAVAMSVQNISGQINCVTSPCNTLPDYQARTIVNWLAILGTIIWLIGVLFEAIGDWQLSRFMRRMKGYDGRYEDKPVLDSGLWKFTRHPNYFGNACLWWGIWLVACCAPHSWLTVFAPIIMTYLLVRISGKALLERNLKKRPAYQDYIARTSGFFPMPPKTKIK